MPRLRRTTVCSNDVQSMTSTRSLDPFVNRTCSVPRTRPGWRPFWLAICRASANSISRSMVMVPSLLAGAARGMRQRFSPVFMSYVRPTEYHGTSAKHHARASWRAPGGKLNNGDPVPAGGETEFPGMEEARANALEVAQEADAPPKARAEDAPALILRGHGVARYPSVLQSRA